MSVLFLPSEIKVSSLLVSRYWDSSSTLSDLVKVVPVLESSTRASFQLPSVLVMVIFAPASSSREVMSFLLTLICDRLMTVSPFSVSEKLLPVIGLPCASVVTI